MPHFEKMKRKCWFFHDWIITKVGIGFTCTMIYRRCAKCGKFGSTYVEGCYWLDDLPNNSIYGRKDK